MLSAVASSSAPSARLKAAYRSYWTHNYHEKNTEPVVKLHQGEWRSYVMAGLASSADEQARLDGRLGGRHDVMWCSSTAPTQRGEQLGRGIGVRRQLELDLHVLHRRARLLS